MMQEKKQQGSVTDHLANERTFLAWLRTSIGIMAFGFVVVKFSLFVKQISLLLNKQTLTPSKGYSALLGIVLVLIGAITGILAYVRYKNVEKQLKEGDYKHSSVLITIITSLVFLVSTLLILYLIQNI
jgi:putative membrane protein